MFNIMGIEFKKDQIIYEIERSVKSTKMMSDVIVSDVNDCGLIELVKHSDEITEDRFNSLQILQQKFLLRICMRISQLDGLRINKNSL